MNSKFKNRTFIISVFLILIFRNINFNKCEISDLKNTDIKCDIGNIKQEILDTKKILELSYPLNKEELYEIEELLKNIKSIERENNKSEHSTNFILGPFAAISQSIKETKIENQLKNIKLALLRINKKLSGV